MRLSFQLFDVMKRVEVRLFKKHTTSFCYNQPRIIQIETTNRCNLSCEWCFRYFRKPHKDMNISEFKTIVEDIAYAKEIYPFGGGEPLLHPQFDKFISLASNHADYVGINSNGVSLDRKATEKLDVSGITELTISIDSPDVKIFNYIRKGADLKKVKKNVEYFSSHSKVPLRIHAVLSTLTLASSLDLPKMAKELGAQKLTFNLLHPTPRSLDLMPEAQKLISTCEKLRMLCAEFRLETNVDDILKKQPTNMCRAPLLTCFIDSEGYMTPCCNYPMLRLGNVLKEGFRSCWNSRKMRTFRKTVLVGNFPIWCQTFCMMPRNLLAGPYEVDRTHKF